MMTFILLTGCPKSHFASITSNPLFIMVDESIVTFAPIFQLGCFKASSFVAFAILSLSHVLNGPPDAVRWILAILLPWALSRHWKIAECSESTGIIGALCFCASEVTIPPAATKVSLFAKAMIFPASIAERVGFSPLNPTMAPTTISTLSEATRSQTDFIPAKAFVSVFSSRFDSSG